MNFLLTNIGVFLIIMGLLWKQQRQMLIHSALVILTVAAYLEWESLISAIVGGGLIYLYWRRKT